MVQLRCGGNSPTVALTGLQQAVLPPDMACHRLVQQQHRGSLQLPSCRKGRACLR